MTELEIVTAEANDHVEGLWWPRDRLAEQALPTVMKKVAHHARKEIE